MNVYEPGQKRQSRARERIAARQRRREEISTLRDEVVVPERLSSQIAPLKPVLLTINDLRWRVMRHPKVMPIVGVLVGIFFLFFVTSHLIGGRVFPNVWSLNAAIGGLSAEEAQAVLTQAWSNQRINLSVEGADVYTASPAEMGLVLDAEKTVEAARSAGMSGIPMGYNISPVVSVDYRTAQTFFLNLTNQVEIAPYNAGYIWEGAQLIGVQGSAGRALDVTLSLQRLQQDPAAIVESRRFDLQMALLPPEVSDPEPYLEVARTFVSQSFVLTGFDPYRNETIEWTTTPTELARWLEAGEGSLQIRLDAFLPFIDSLNTTLNTDPNLPERYIEPGDTIDSLTQSIENGSSSALIRIRYRPTQYTVVAGDTGYRIARKTGIPYFLLEQTNSGRDLNILSPGDVVNVPSRDETMPLMPVLGKRIIVNLNTQSLVAFEGDQIVFSWLISSGMEAAPTYPGIFQILDHEEIASGSSYTLCSELGCASWDMYWFMGIYEVTPGLVNGFHGAVDLPTGRILGDSNVGAPFTFGCVMSENSNAELLYNWADAGTVVEIVSSEYAPQSNLARIAFQSS